MLFHTIKEVPFHLQPVKYNNTAHFHSANFQEKNEMWKKHTSFYIQVLYYLGFIAYPVGDLRVYTLNFIYNVLIAAFPPVYHPLPVVNEWL